MNELDLLLSQNKDFKIAGVKFKSSAKVYSYKTIKNLKEGDNVVVDSPSNGLVVAEVVSISDGADLGYAGKLKWIVQKVDVTDYEYCLEVEEALSKKLNSIRLAKLREEVVTSLASEIGEDAFKTLPRL